MKSTSLRRAVVLGALCAAAASAQSIGAVTVDNTSSPPPVNANSTFSTATAIVQPPALDGAIASFKHRMAFRNTRVATGGPAQINKRNVVYQIDFTVSDPNNTGFRLSVESVMRGVSALNQTVATGAPSLATGLALGVTYDDSTDAPDTYANLVGILGQSTPGVMTDSAETVAELQESARNAVVGVYVGDTTFSFRFTSTTTPTTNVAFQNSAEGDGLVAYGIGALPAGFEDVSIDDLGHFMTFSARFLLAGDTNADGLVNFADLNDVLARFGDFGEPDFVGADQNGDGVVNFIDLNIVLGNFGNSLP